MKALTCPNCGAAVNPAVYRCEYCGSYVFISDEKFKDFRSVQVELPHAPQNDTDRYPGVYVFGRLLGAGERPIALGSANYFTGLVSAGGKLLLTNKSLSFSAHAFNVGQKETSINLSQISDVKVGANHLISQQLLVTANGKKHKFVVYHGNSWVQAIKDAMSAPAEISDCSASVSVAQPETYIEELQQLKRLCDMGVITEEEFVIKKRFLLGI